MPVDLAGRSTERSPVLFRPGGPPCGEADGRTGPHSCCAMGREQRALNGCTPAGALSARPSGKQPAAEGMPAPCPRQRGKQDPQR
eukprot:11291532-Alexandrium_andersonii.AAC.1